jgi:hypothetical protein
MTKKTLKPLLVLIGLSFFVINCGNQNPISHETSVIPTATFLNIPSDGIFINPQTDSIDAFVSINKAVVSITDTIISVIFTMGNLPTNLVFNHTTLAENAVEYEWSMYIDIDDNGQFDYSLSTFHFKFPGKSQNTGAITNNSQTNVWKADTVGGSASTICNASCCVIGNNITLLVPKSAHADLVKITNAAKVRFRAYYDFGTVSNKEKIPN